MKWGSRLGLGVMLAGSLAAGRAQAPPMQAGARAQQILTTMLANEDEAAKHRDRFAYVSKERSERTGGHLWTEKVVETSAGRVRMLIEEDGRPLEADRTAAERGRLAGIVADPAGFAKREQAQKDDDAHAKQMLSLLPKAFLFSEVHPENGALRMEFQPNPGYSPQSMEERVLHGMAGTVWVDAKTIRLRKIEGRLGGDVSIGFGLLATIKAGSNFGTEREAFDGGEWKTVLINTDISGKAIFFKAIARKQHTERAEFRRVPNEVSVAQAVAMVEQ